MAEGESTLTHGYTPLTKDETKEWWARQPAGKFKVGLIRSKELDKVITVFTETFDFGKKGRSSSVQSGGDGEAAPKEEGVGKEEAAAPAPAPKEEAAAPAPKQEEPAPKEEAAPAPASKEEEAAPAPASAPAPAPAPVTRNIPFNEAGNSTTAPVEVAKKPETFLTSSDFDKRYLGWVKPDDPNIATIKNTMKNLFRFIFGKQTIGNLNKFHAKMRIAYTSLQALQKIPCKKTFTGDETLWEHFKQSLEYRCEAALQDYRDTKLYLPEVNQELEQKYKLVYELQTMIRFLEDNNRCIIYGKDPSMQEEEEKDTDYARILEVFRDFIRMKKEGTAQPLPSLLQAFTLPGGKEGSEKYYKDIIELLDFTASTEYTRELEDIVMQLSALIVAHSTVQKISKDVTGIRHSLDILRERRAKAQELQERLDGIREVNADTLQAQEALNTLRAQMDEEEAASQLQSGQQPQPQLQQQQHGGSSTATTRIHELQGINAQPPITPEALEEYKEESNRKREAFEEELSQLPNPPKILRKLGDILGIQSETPTLSMVEENLTSLPSSSIESLPPSLAAAMEEWSVAKQEERDAEDAVNSLYPTASDEKGMSKKESFCDLFMQALLLQASASKGGNKTICQSLVQKGYAAIQKAGQRPLVCTTLKKLIDTSFDHRDHGFLYSKLDLPAEELTPLISAVTSTFSEEDQRILDSFAPPASFHSEPPAEYAEILGTTPYSLTGKSDTSTLVGLDEEIELEEDEKEAIERNGLSLGTVVFLYLICTLA